MVRTRDLLAWEWLPSMIAWCAQVTEAPEDKRIILFNKGTPKGLNTEIPNGGQTPPSSALGLKLLWKYLQKKERKKNTSEIINKIIPLRSPSSTMYECFPI